MLFDLEPNGSDLDEEGRHAPGGWIAVSIFSCTILAVIAVLVWTIVTSIPKSDSQRSIESDIAAKYNVSAKILDSTPKGMVAGAIGNNLARNSTMSFASMQHNASSSSFEARALPPTRRAARAKVIVTVGTVVRKGSVNADLIAFSVNVTRNVSSISISARKTVTVARECVDAWEAHRQASDLASTTSQRVRVPAMEVTLEGSNSAETLPPWGGVAGIHRPVTGNLAAW
ncbi:hypothetical protein F1880_002293 [Penicillium rolfsii]|nr:hypothetical protein F1880_002293 [Penicillium rolfsii]